MIVKLKVDLKSARQFIYWSRYGCMRDLHRQMKLSNG
jgi:hypothetical protein